MGKLPKPIIWNYILVFISVLLLGWLLSNIFSNNTRKEIEINPIITVRDSTDLKQINSYSPREIKLTIEDSLEEIVDREFDKTINYLNLTIAIFGIFLTLILVVFGFFTIRKMAEAKRLLDEILAAPDAVMEKYHDNQLNELLPKLLSSNQRQRSEAIQRIYGNNQLVVEKHYDILVNAMKREYENITSLTAMNVYNLFETLSRLDYSKTVSIGYELFDKYYEHHSMNYIVPQLIESTEKEHKEKLVKLICDSNDNNKVNKLINSIENFDVFNQEMLIEILKNSPSHISFRILNSIIRKKIEIDLRPIILNSGRSTFKLAHFTQFLNLLNQNDQLEYDLVQYLIKAVIRNDQVNEDQIANMIRNLNAQIKSDEDLNNLILQLRKSVQLKDEYSFEKAIEKMGNRNAPRVQEIIDRLSK